MAGFCDFSGIWFIIFGLQVSSSSIASSIKHSLRGDGSLRTLSTCSILFLKFTITKHISRRYREKQIMMKGWKNFLKLSSLQDSVYSVAYLHKRQRAVLSHAGCTWDVLPQISCGQRGCVGVSDMDHVYCTSKRPCGSEPPIASPVGFMLASTATICLFFLG